MDELVSAGSLSSSSDEEDFVLVTGASLIYVQAHLATSWVVASRRCEIIRQICAAVLDPMMAVTWGLLFCCADEEDEAALYDTEELSVIAAQHTYLGGARFQCVRCHVCASP